MQTDHLTLPGPPEKKAVVETVDPASPDPTSPAS